MKIRIIENEEGDRGHTRGQLDIFVTPLGDSTTQDIDNALNNKEYYGSYLINTRDKHSVNKAIEDYFGPNLPSHKRTAEKKRGEKFPIKTKQAMDDLVQNLGGEKPNILTWEIRDKTIFFPSSKNNSQLATLNIIKQVLGAADIKYKSEKIEDSSKYLSEVNRMKKIAGLK
jgi:hypothetical protein